MQSTLCLFVTIFVVIQIGEVAMMVTAQNGNLNQQLQYRSQTVDNDEDLTYSDLETLIQSREQNFYRQIRDYGVPSDVAHMHMPRGMTIGELLGQDKDKDTSEEEFKNHKDDDQSSSTFDPWSIVWYIGSFGGLIAFFLVISCSEWCCLKKRVARQAAEAERRRHQVCPATNQTRARCETLPPAYDLFAPPPYEDVVYGEKKNRIDVFVVPVHANVLQNAPVANNGLRNEEIPPPEYSAIAMPHEIRT